MIYYGGQQSGVWLDEPKYSKEEAVDLKKRSGLEIKIVMNIWNRWRFNICVDA